MELLLAIKKFSLDLRLIGNTTSQAEICIYKSHTQPSRDMYV